MDTTDATYERYMRDISRYERITADQEAELSKTIVNSRDAGAIESAVDELVQSNLLLVVHCLKDFARYLEAPGARISYMDLVAEGNIGLVNAARNFDATCGKGKKSRKRIRFSTYACKSIKNAMRRALKLSRFIHIPEHHFSYWTRIKELEDKYGDALTDDMLQKDLNVGEAKLDMLKQSAETRTSLLDDFSVDRDGASWSETIGDQHQPNPCDETERQDLRKFLVNELACLPERTQRMIALLYFDHNVSTYSDLARRFGVSKERCRQVCTQGLTTLRKRLESRSGKVLGYEDSLDSVVQNHQTAPSTGEQMLHNLLTMPPVSATLPDVEMTTENAA